MLIPWYLQNWASLINKFSHFERDAGLKGRRSTVLLLQQSRNHECSFAPGKRIAEKHITKRKEMTHLGCQKILPGSGTYLLCCWILTKNVRIKNCKSKSNEVLVNDRFMCHSIYLTTAIGNVISRQRNLSSIQYCQSIFNSLPIGIHGIWKIHKYMCLEYQILLAM